MLNYGRAFGPEVSKLMLQHRVPLPCRGSRSAPGTWSLIRQTVNSKICSRENVKNQVKSGWSPHEYRAGSSPGLLMGSLPQCSWRSTVWSLAHGVQGSSFLTYWGETSSVATPTTTHGNFLSSNVQLLVAIKQQYHEGQAPVLKPVMPKTYVTGMLHINITLPTNVVPPTPRLTCDSLFE